MKKIILALAMFAFSASAFAEVERADQFKSVAGVATTAKDVTMGDTLTLQNGAYSAVVKASTAEGLTGTDTRFGVDATRNFIFCDIDDIDNDFALATATDPTIRIFGSSGLTNNVLNISRTSISRTHSGSGVLSFVSNNDISTGPVFKFATPDTTVECTGSDAQQSWVNIDAKVKQTGTAAFDALYVNISDSESYGDGTTGVGNNLLRLDVAGVNKFRVAIDGNMTANSLITASASQSVVDDGTITLATGVAGTVTVWTEAEYGTFFVGTDGAVTRLSGSANTANTDSDTKLCVYDGGTGAVIKNRLGSTKTVRYHYMYS